MSTSMASGSMGDGVLRSSGLRSTGMERKSELGYRRGHSNKTKLRYFKHNISAQNLLFD